LCFSGPVFDLWRGLGLLDHRHPIRHLSPIDLWNQRFEEILGPSRNSGFKPALTETCRLQDFLAQIVTGAGHANAHHADMQWAARACRLIENLSGNEDGWNSVAQQLGTTPDNFRRRFKRLTGQSPVRFQIGRSIDRACELMQEGRLNNREIADILGFCDEYYFSRKFKEITGKSPRAFRNSLPVSAAPLA
jgi:AraC-like DNA-binding protein